VWVVGGGWRSLQAAAGARTLRARVGALLPAVALSALILVTASQGMGGSSGGGATAVAGGGGGGAGGRDADLAPRYALALAPPARYSVVDRMPIVPAHTRLHQRVYVRVFNVGGGGPQCLAGLAWLFSQALGVQGTFATRNAPIWSYYLRNVSVGDCVPPNPRDSSAEDVASWRPCRGRGDIVINHEFFMDKYDPALGIKEFIWELGDVSPLSTWQATHGAAKYLGHSFYTRDFVLGSRYALLRTFVPHGQWGEVATSPAALRAGKENLVLLDDEGTEDVVGRLAPLRVRWPDLEVVVLKGFSREQLKGLFIRAKVLIDAGMRGMERITMECLQFYVVPLHVRVLSAHAHTAPFCAPIAFFNPLAPLPAPSPLHTKHARPPPPPGAQPQWRQRV
jgi:hypothetical protein